MRVFFLWKIGPCQKSVWVRNNFFRSSSRNRTASHADREYTMCSMIWACAVLILVEHFNRLRTLFFFLWVGKRDLTALLFPPLLCSAPAFPCRCRRRVLILCFLHWNLQRPLMLKGHTRPLTHVKYNREGDLLFTCAKDKLITAWYVDNGERLGTYEGHEGAVMGCDVNCK